MLSYIRYLYTKGPFVFTWMITVLAFIFFYQLIYKDDRTWISPQELKQYHLVEFLNERSKEKCVEIQRYDEIRQVGISTLNFV